MFQACLGEMKPKERPRHLGDDLVWFCLLDFFSVQGKNVPDQEDLALCLHIACSEVKSAGANHVFVFARTTQNPLGNRKRFPCLFIEKTMERFGFLDPELCQDSTERFVFSIMQRASKKYLDENDFQARVVTLSEDTQSKMI